MSRTILALALASSVSALLPAKVPLRVRGVYSAPLASSSALLSMRSRPPYMSTPESRCKDAADQIKGVDGPLLQTLATVCCTIEDAMPNKITLAKYEPSKVVDGHPDKVNDQLDQPYKVTDAGGVGALGAFTSSLASYGTVLDSIIDFHGDFEYTVPPFAALVVQPKDEPEAPILILAWRGSATLFDWVNDFAASPTLSTRWSSETKEINAHGGFVNLVENTFSRHEDAIVDLITKHNVKRAFITGHSLGGGIANVAHLVVRAQLKKIGSPWYKLNSDRQVDWLSCTFASPFTIVRLYEEKNIPPPPLIVDLDASSYNLVYGCDPVPRIGMLAYTGNFMEIVLPEIIDEDILPKLLEKHPLAGGLLKWLALSKLMEGGKGLVEFLKKKGYAYVANSLTQIGTVVYQKSENEEYMYLKTEANIRKVLNVKDTTEFKELWGDKKEYLETLGDAHLHITKFVPGAKF